MFVISITAEKTTGSKRRETTMNVHHAVPAPTLTMGEIVDGIAATEDFLSKLIGGRVTVSLVKDSDNTR